MLDVYKFLSCAPSSTFSDCHKVLRPLPLPLPLPLSSEHLQPCVPLQLVGPLHLRKLSIMLLAALCLFTEAVSSCKLSSLLMPLSLAGVEMVALTAIAVTEMIIKLLIFLLGDQENG
jgi:hypothetical protein